MNLSEPITSTNTSLQSVPSATDGRTLAAVLAASLPLPASALFIGLAEDGLPVLVNLGDPAPAPILVAADAGAGKTRLLKTMARAIEHVHDPERVRYAVITEHPGEWTEFEHSHHCEGLLAFHHALTTGYLASTAARPSQTGETSVVMLIDGYEALASDADLRSSTDILLKAPPVGLWPVVTLNTSGALPSASLLSPFTIRLFGYVRDQAAAASLSIAGDAYPGTLQPQAQFAARQGNRWLPFWLPELD